MNMMMMMMMIMVVVVVVMMMMMMNYILSVKFNSNLGKKSNNF